MVFHPYGGRHGYGYRGGPGARGGRGWRGGRMASAADLQLIVAALLAEKPRHGYEIIKAVQERSNGYYTPSASMVYPSLTYLEETGHASVAVEGARKLYSLTAEGRASVEANRERIANLFSELARVGQGMQRAQRAYESEAAGPASALDQVRRDLKAALFDVADAPPDEQARVAQILRRALTEIDNR
jgi:DNA-binding PadR family transcriptional regulator